MASTAAAVTVDPRWPCLIGVGGRTVHPPEVAHDVFQAWMTFALWDVARRAQGDAGPDEHRKALGSLFAPMTEIAAANPAAWFRVARSADDLTTPTADNRMVCYPYTKYLMSVMDVDMGAAVLLSSHAGADRLGVPPDRRVYLRGWCSAMDPLYVAGHEPLWGSPAMGAASREALAVAGVGIDDPDLLHEAESVEWCGTTVTLTPGPGATNLIHP